MTYEFPGNIQPLLLMSFNDVLRETFRGKQYEYSAEPDTPAPQQVIDLWRSRGYEPAHTGMAIVVFHENGRASKPYNYPLYFWSAG